MSTKIDKLAKQYVLLDQERLKINRQVKELEDQMEAIETDIKKLAELPDKLDMSPGVPIVKDTGKFIISQVRRQNPVKAHTRDYISFRIVHS